MTDSTIGKFLSLGYLITHLCGLQCVTQPSLSLPAAGRDVLFRQCLRTSRRSRCVCLTAFMTAWRTFLSQVCVHLHCPTQTALLDTYINLCTFVLVLPLLATKDQPAGLEKVHNTVCFRSSRPAPADGSTDLANLTINLFFGRGPASGELTGGTSGPASVGQHRCACHAPGLATLRSAASPWTSNISQASCSKTWRLDR